MERLDPTQAPDFRTPEQRKASEAEFKNLKEALDESPYPERIIDNQPTDEYVAAEPHANGKSTDSPEEHPAA